MDNNFKYQGERFADIQMLRYRLPGFEALSLNQKLYIYYLSEATLWGRDITFDQFGKYNLLIRQTLEKVYIANKKELAGTPEFDKLTEYLKRVWFSNGIHHHYGCEKFKPEFSQSFFEDIVRKTLGNDAEKIPEQITPIIFNPNILPKRVNKADNEDLIKTSACNYYENVSQKEVEEYYSTLSDKNDPEPISYGLNSTLIKDANGKELKVTKTDVKLSNGTIDMVIKDANLTNLRDETIVAYETIYFTNSKGEKVVIAQEHDDNSLTQSLRVVGVPINFIKKNQFDEVVPGSTFSLRKDTENGTEIEHWVSTSKLHTTYLADGTYFLVETDAPDGYALNKPVKFTIKAGKLYIDGEEIPSLTVVHRDPNLTSLPSTGGIGTGIFFTVGMLSMLAAAYAIKKRED